MIRRYQYPREYENDLQLDWDGGELVDREDILQKLLNQLWKYQNPTTYNIESYNAIYFAMRKLGFTKDEIFSNSIRLPEEPDGL